MVVYVTGWSPLVGPRFRRGRVANVTFPPGDLTSFSGGHAGEAVAGGAVRGGVTVTLLCSCVCVVR